MYYYLNIVSQILYIPVLLSFVCTTVLLHSLIIEDINIDYRKSGNTVKKMFTEEIIYLN